MAVIESTPAGKDPVMHVATWLTTAVVAQVLIGVPPTKNATVPPGATGVKVTPARVAFNVTGVFNAEGLAGVGAGVRLMVGLSFVIV